MKRVGSTIFVIILGAQSSVVAQTAPADSCHGFELRDVAKESGVRFVHETGGTGDKHLPETMGAGVAWVDVNGDGWLDLYVVQSGTFPPSESAAAANRLFVNRGDGTFRDSTEGSGADHRGYGQGVTAADVNGDGSVDLFLSNFGPDALLLNRGDGTFQAAPQPPVSWAEDGWSSSAAFADGDGDGDLDLYVTRYVEYTIDTDIFCGDPSTGQRRYCDPTLFQGAHDRYYRNRGDGTFEDVTEQVGLGQAAGKGLGVLFTDLDGDRHPDLYVANDLTINLLFRNTGKGQFESLSLISGAGLNRQGKAEAGMGLALGDFDGDRDPDLLVTNFDVETNTMYRNLGDLFFEDVSNDSGFGAPSFNLLGFGIVAGDLNLDGYLDAYVANGHIYEHPTRDSTHYRQPDLVLMGGPGGRFVARHCGAESQVMQVGRGLASGDYDNDGDLDLVLNNSGGALQLLRNQGLDRDWYGVHLVGKAPNTGAVGASVRLTTTTREQTRWSLAGDSYQSTSDPRLLFGVASGERATKIQIDWPDGDTTTLGQLVPGRYLVVDQATGVLRSPSWDPSPTPSRWGWVALFVGIAVLGFAVRWWLKRA